MVLVAVVAAAASEHLRSRGRDDGNDAYSACNDDGNVFETEQAVAVVAPGPLSIILVLLN
jgi:hypothetical protein